MSQNLLIFLGALTIFIILIIWYYPLVHIFLFRIFFGKFSPQYFEVHKKYTGKRPFQHCIKDDLVNYIAPFFDKRKEKLYFTSNADIKFGKVPFGRSFRSVYRELPNPFCINSVRNKSFSYKVLGYRNEMFDQDMKSYYFFINDTFVMGIYNFKSSSETKSNEILNIIRKKYLQQSDVLAEDFIIEGINKVSMHFKNTGFNISLTYLDYNQDEIIDLLEDYWNQSVGKGINLADFNFESEIFDKI